MGRLPRAGDGTNEWMSGCDPEKGRKGGEFQGTGTVYVTAQR